MWNMIEALLWKKQSVWTNIKDDVVRTKNIFSSQININLPKLLGIYLFIKNKN